MSWFTQQWAVYTPTSGPVSLTDTPSAERDGGPDGSGIDIVFTGDTPSAQRASGPDGTLVITTILTDSPSALRNGGPNGAAIPDLVVTDTPSGSRSYGPEGSAQVGVTFGLDSPSALRLGGPDGLAQPDLVITDRPLATRFSGPDGLVALGLVFTDGPSAERLGGPDGSVFADVGGGVTITDSPGASRFSGPDGAMTFGITLVGDAPSGTRFGGPDGLLIMDIVLTDSPCAGRLGGPDGVVVPLLGDTPGGVRAAGPSGSMGIAIPVTGDTPGAERLGGPSGSLFIGIGADVIAGTTSPAGVRYGGPDGYLLMAVLPSKPPYIPVSPFVVARYELWLADTVTGKLLWELPSDTFQWSSKLNDIGTMRATLVIEDLWDALSDQDERDPRIMVREILSGPWRFSLVLKWGTSIPWAGPYISMSRPEPRKVEINAAEIAKMFTRRVLVNPAATFATDPSADTSFGGNAAKPHIAAALITQAMQGAGNSLPIVVNDPGGVGTDNRVYYGYDLAYYWDRLRELSAEIDGPEVRFDPQIVSRSDGDYVQWTAQIGNLHVGRNGTTWVFDEEVNAVTGLDGDGSNMALGVWAAGSGQSRDKLVAHTSDSTLLAIGWPMIETVDASRNSETAYPILAAYGSSVLAAYKKPTQAFKVSVPADVDPMVGTYRVGDDFAVDIHNDPIIPDGFYSRRIGALSGSEQPWVTITDTDPLPVGVS